MPRDFVVQMKQHYPFAQLGRILPQGITALIKKSLYYQDEQQLEMITTMIHFLQVARHKHLVNIAKASQGDHRVELYYEYVPLKLERQLISANAGILNTLKAQLIQLIQHLINLGIRLEFDPQSIGIGKDLSVKYFLKEFSVDMEGHQICFIAIKQKIGHYFEALSQKWRHQQQIDKIKEEKCVKLSAIESVSTNLSVSSIGQLPNFHKEPSRQLLKSHNGHLQSDQAQQKVQSSKKRYLQAMARFRRAIQK